MKFIIGIDEAGRGPLAGPVSVGVVAVCEGFDVEREFLGVGDSKKLSEKKREKIFDMLVERVAKGDALRTVEFESAQTVDTDGIVPSVLRALARGVEIITKKYESRAFQNSGFVKPDFHILLDGSLRAPEKYSQETIIHGDALVPIISLASIVAKVERDRVMCDFAKQYPEYGFERHKGYGTKAHYEALSKYGLCDIHRKTFIHMDL